MAQARDTALVVSKKRGEPAFFYAVLIFQLIFVIP
jgi:hypothetical protein